MALLDTVSQIENNEAQRRRRSMGQRMRNQQNPEVSSFFHSRFAGNETDQGQPFNLPPAIDVGYNMQEVLARMQTNFLENRQRFQEMRAKQVAMFQAAQPFNPDMARPPEGNMPLPTGGGSPAPTDNNQPTPNEHPPTTGGGNPLTPGAHPGGGFGGGPDVSRMPHTPPAWQNPSPDLSRPGTDRVRSILFGQ